MSFHRESPVRPGGPARAERRSSEQQVSNADGRAINRYRIARTVDAFGGAMLSATAQREIVNKAMAAGLLTGLAPSARTVRSWVKKHTTGENTAAVFHDAPRSGRPRLTLDARLTAIISRAVRTQRPRSIRGVHVALKAKAQELGLSAPSYGTVFSLYAAEGTLNASAASHGKEAAEIDGLPHSTVPAPHTHDVWTPDELILPIWTRMYDPDTKGWRSFKPTVVLIIDNCSRVIVSYWVCDPARRFGRSDDEDHMGADTTDILAALVGAAAPEVAYPACRAYAGYLPRTLRWDRAKTHDKLAKEIRDLGIQVPKLPGNRPINRGIVERVIGTLKGWCDTTIGYSGEYTPTDRAAEAELEAEQQVAAGTDERVRTKTSIEPDLLCDIVEVQQRLDAIIRRYNEEHEHRGLEGQCPGDVYRIKHRRPPERRPGRDIFHLLSPKVVRVGKEGVVHWQEGWSYNFASAAGAISLRLGTKVTYRPDPALRGLFAGAEGHELFLKPLAAWAAEQKPADVAREQRAAAAVAHHEAANTRRLEDAQAIGLQLLDRSDARAAAARASSTSDGDDIGGSEIPPSITLVLDEDLVGFGSLFPTPAVGTIGIAADIGTGSTTGDSTNE
jgi:transposase InsO family protein